MNSRRGNLVCLIIQPRALNLWRGWWAIDFQVSFCVLYKSSSIFMLGNRFPSSVQNFLFTHITTFYRSFHVFLTIAICIYLCFAGEVSFRFLAFGFISHTTRISNKTSFLCKRLVVKNKFRNNLSRFTKLKCFALDIQNQKI